MQIQEPDLPKSLLVPDKCGGLNGSTQRQLEAHAQGFQQLGSFASADFKRKTTLARSD
jgi:hypothetical protein